MNATSSGVACSAAKIRSPSFSRSSSSTTTTAFPAAMSLIARSMSFNISVSELGRSHELLDVLGDDVDLEVHRVADGLGTQHGDLEGGRDEPDAERLVIHRHHGQRDPVDGDRALLHHVPGQVRGKGEPQHLPLAGGLPRDDPRDAVDVALYQMT